MRLIDAYEFVEILNNQELMEHLAKVGMKYPQNLSLPLAEIIDAIPTAYDIDKVVDEFEKVKTINVDVGYGTIYKTIRKDVAIEIVKQGGVADDVCEWIKYDYRTICPKNHDASRSVKGGWRE